MIPVNKWTLMLTIIASVVTLYIGLWLFLTKPDVLTTANNNSKPSPDRMHSLIQ